MLNALRPHSGPILVAVNRAAGMPMRPSGGRWRPLPGRPCQEMFKVLGDGAPPLVGVVRERAITLGIKIFSREAIPFPAAQSRDRRKAGRLNKRRAIHRETVCINLVPVFLPPLREHDGDLDALLRHHGIEKPHRAYGVVSIGPDPLPSIRRACAHSDCEPVPSVRRLDRR